MKYACFWLVIPYIKAALIASSHIDRYTNNGCLGVGLLRMGDDEIEAFTTENASSQSSSHKNFSVFFVNFKIGFILSASLGKNWIRKSVDQQVSLLF